MNNLSEVSKTALITLRSRVIESLKPIPVLHDPVGVDLLNRIMDILPSEEGDKTSETDLPVSLTRHIALRARKYDNYVRDFIHHNPEGLVVSLGCGFDTRYWRVSEKPWNYIELDLPEVIEAKESVLKGLMKYKTFGISVLDFRWIDDIAEIQRDNVMFLAEGLLMYLNEDAVSKIFKQISENFSRSYFVFEVVRKKYTRGFWKKMVEMKMNRNLASGAGSSFNFGVKKAEEIEKFSSKLHVVEEWSYFEDKDIKPGFLYHFKHLKSFSRTQWTVKARIE